MRSNLKLRRMKLKNMLEDPDYFKKMVSGKRFKRKVKNQEKYLKRYNRMLGE